MATSYCENCMTPLFSEPLRQRNLLCPACSEERQMIHLGGSGRVPRTARARPRGFWRQLKAYVWSLMPTVKKGPLHGGPKF